MFVIWVRIQVLPDCIDAFIAATIDNHRNTRLEPGNLRFDLQRSIDTPDRFTLFEVYGQEADLQQHHKTAHYARWKETVAPMMAIPRSGERYVSVLPDPWV